MNLPESVMRENNPEILRALLAMTNDELLDVRRRFQMALKAEGLQQRLELKDKLVQLQKALYHSGPERAGVVESKERERGKQEVLFHSRTLFPAPKSKEKKHLEQEVVDHGMSRQELVEAACEYTGKSGCSGKEFQEIAGFYEESEEITVIREKFVRKLHRRKRYRLDPKALSAESDKATVIITAPGPDKLAPSCKYSIDFAIEVVVNKYLLHLPLDRQRREIFKPAGLKSITPKTLYNLCSMVAVHGEKMAEKISKQILTSGLCAHVDETPWKINDPNSSNGYMWVLSNQAGSYYRFEPSRSGKIAKEIFEGYKGPVMSDDYSGYERLKEIEGIQRALCWAHARRKFFEIKTNYPSQCREILVLYDELFKLEREATSLDELEKLRAKESTEKVAEIKAWLEEHFAKFLPQSGMRKAIKYSLSNWEMLTKFLEDPRIPLSNNDAERSIRHVVVGRKNFYGSQTINGADTAAVLYTIIESCKKHELDPRDYFRRLITDANHKRETPSPLELARTRYHQNMAIARPA